MALPSARPRTSPFEEVVVAGSRISRRDFAGPSPALAARLNATPFVGQPFDQAASLRAAAAEGRTAELQTLLARGIPVDAPDPEGDTALMISIQAGRLEAVALLRRYGASLDQRNRAGLSARDMALAKGDPALDRAIGLEP
jgi:ankyrin repeat protein